MKENPIWVEVGTITDAERRYGFADPAECWVRIIRGKPFSAGGKRVTLRALPEKRIDGTLWIVEALEEAVASVAGG